MSWWEALILGLVQGLTEFFPVSSSGHLVIGQELLGLSIPGILFDVVVHVATLVSVLVVYRSTLVLLFRGMFRRGKESTWPYILKVGLATLPTVIAGLTLKDWFEARFDDPVFAGTMILVTGCVVWSSRWAMSAKRVGPLELLPLLVAATFAWLAGTILPFALALAALIVVMGASRLTAPADKHAAPTWGGALMIGIAQVAAITPGISRSGSTVIAGLWRRLDPVAAAEFSFLMSIPAIVGAAVLQVPDALAAETLAVSPLPLVIGFISAAGAGIVAIRFFVALLRRQNFYVFAVYCWAAAGVFLYFHLRGG